MRYDPDLARRFGGKPSNKYRAVKARLPGSLRLYASGWERDRARDLQLMERAGEIRDLVEQPWVDLTKYHTYHPDFAYYEKSKDGGRWVFEDVKGASTERFVINCRLWHERGPGVLIVTRKAEGGRFLRVKEIMPDKVDVKMWRKNRV